MTKQHKTKNNKNYYLWWNSNS